MSSQESEERRRSERVPLEASIEFFVDADIIRASSVDVNQTGINFSTPEPLPISMRIEVDGEREERMGQLVWARKTPEGSMRYGLVFTSDEPSVPPEIPD